MRILVTGGAGFIGSNIVDALLNDPRVQHVRILDNLSTGYLQNVKSLLSSDKCSFIEGDIREMQTCMTACKDIDRICHQAALGSVPRSIKDPLTTHHVNITGSLNMLQAAYEQGIKRFVFAASSSTYGDSVGVPKVEHKIGKPLSPYAITKYVNELYAEIYAKIYGIEYIGLRYFNIFGPKQDPHGAYAAVIPIFLHAAMQNKSAMINGDGTISRDFTYVANAVQANLKALFTEEPTAINQIYNIACGDTYSLNELWNSIKAIAGITTDAQYGPARKGDIQYSLANIEKAKSLLGYQASIDFNEGLQLTYDWMKQQQS